MRGGSFPLLGLCLLLVLQHTDAAARTHRHRRSQVPRTTPGSLAPAQPLPGPEKGSEARPSSEIDRTIKTDSQMESKKEPEKEPEPAPLEPPEPPPAPLRIDPVPADKQPEDVVEIIDATGAPPPPRTEPVAPVSPDTFQLTGWTRARLSIGLLGTASDAGDRYAVPHDRLVAQGQLFLRARYARGRWFEAVLSGLAGAGLFEQDARPPDDFNLVNGDVRSSYEATLREAYVGFFFRRFDLRIGQQRTAWGRGEVFAPNDVLNPVDLRDQFLTETEVVRLPTLALRGDLALGPAVLSAVISPYFQPNRFESYGGNWALIQPAAPALYRTLASAVASALAIDPTLYPSLQPLLQQTALPPADLRGTAMGARLQLALHRLDLDFFYHYGYDYNPALRIDPALSSALAQLDPATADPSTLSSSLLSGVTQGTVSATYVRRHHAGLSAVTTAGPLVLRGDFAADSQKVFTGRDLQGVLCPSIETVLGAEYQHGDLGKAAILELHYQYIHDLPSEDALLFQRKHNVSLGALLRWTFLREHLRLELRGAVGLTPVSYVLRPQISFLHRGLELRLGLLIPGGEDASLGRYYDRNLSLYTVARFSF